MTCEPREASWSAAALRRFSPDRERAGNRILTGDRIRPFRRSVNLSAHWKNRNWAKGVQYYLCALHGVVTR